MLAWLLFQGSSCTHREYKALKGKPVPHPCSQEPVAPLSSFSKKLCPVLPSEPFKAVPELRHVQERAIRCHSSGYDSSLPSCELGTNLSS